MATGWQRRHAVHRERGQATAEFALSLTLILVLLLASIDLGRAFNSYIAIINAAREGARVGVTTSNPFNIEPAVRREIQGNGLNPSLVTVTYTWTGPGQALVVNVSYQFSLVAMSFLPFGAIELRTSTTMLIT